MLLYHRKHRGPVLSSTSTFTVLDERNRIVIGAVRCPLEAAALQAAEDVTCHELMSVVARPPWYAQATGQKLRIFAVVK